MPSMDATFTQSRLPLNACQCPGQTRQAVLRNRGKAFIAAIGNHLQQGLDPPQANRGDDTELGHRSALPLSCTPSPGSPPSPLVVRDRLVRHPLGGFFIYLLRLVMRSI